jgi:hypothetical protein
MKRTAPFDALSTVTNSLHLPEIIMNPTTYHQNCCLFVMDRDEDGASIDDLIKIPVTIGEFSDPDEPEPFYEVRIDRTDLDRLITELTALRHSNR